MDAKAKAVLEAMKKGDGPMRPGDVAKALQMDKGEVAKIIDQLKKDGLVISPKRCFYAPA